MIGAVIFVGGELDGRMQVLPEIPSRYRVPYYRCLAAGWFAPASVLDAIPPLNIQVTEYVLTKRGDVLFYVEQALFELSTVQGIDPRPEVAL